MGKDALTLDESLSQALDEEKGTEEVVEETVADEGSSTSEDAAEETDDSLKNDEEFQELSEEVEKTPGLLEKNKRFREVYKRMKEAERKTSDFETQLAEKPEESPQYNVADLERFAKEQGMKLTKEEKKEIAELDGLLDKVQKPEDREWLKTYASAIEKKIDDRYQDKLKAHDDIAMEYRLDRSERQARALIKDVNIKNETSLDFDKDVDPELVNIIKSTPGINKTNADVYTLTQMFLAKNGIGLGKKLAAREQKRLTEDKKKAAMETGPTTSSPKIDHSTASIRELMQEAEREEGVQFL